MLDAYLRANLDRYLLSPVASRCPRWCQANTITGAALIFGLLAAVLLMTNQIIAALVAMVLSGFCDALDGTIARQQQTTAVGAVYDIVSDRVVEAAIIFALFFLSPASRAMATVWMLISILLCITSFLVVGIFTENTSEKSFHYSPGLMERFEAFLFFAAMAIWPDYFNHFAAVFVGLVLLTTARRLWQFRTNHRAA